MRAQILPVRAHLIRQEVASDPLVKSREMLDMLPASSVKRAFGVRPAKSIPPMKTKSESAFFNRRVLIGLSVLAGVFTLPLLFLLGNPAAAGGDSAAPTKQNSLQSQTGTLEKMIAASGSVVVDIDLNRLDASGSATQKPEALRFTVKPNSFFTILVFNNVLRGVQSGSAMALIPQNSTTLPAALSASLDKLVVEKLPSGAAFDLAVRDAKTGFAFFNIEGQSLRLRCQCAVA